MRKVLLAAFMLLFMSVAANAQSLSVNGLYDQLVLILDKLNDSIDTNLQDQFTDIVDLYFCEDLATTTVAVDAPAEATSVTLTDSTGFLDGDCINFAESGHSMQGIIQGAPVGNVVNFSPPLDRSFTAGATVKAGEYNMSVNGSVTPRHFVVKPPVGVKWDIVRVILNINDSSAMDDGLFGSQASLTNGLLLRKKDGTFHNIFLINNNGGMRERAYDVSYSTKAPSGTNGMSMRRTFGGQSKNGVVIRLDGDLGEYLEFRIADNITQDKVAATAQGHIVED